MHIKYLFYTHSDLITKHVQYIILFVKCDKTLMSFLIFLCLQTCAFQLSQLPPLHSTRLEEYSPLH
jgi:hypothetical protein